MVMCTPLEYRNFWSNGCIAPGNLSPYEYVDWLGA